LSSRKQFTSLRKAMKERREDGFTIPDVPSKYQSRAQQYYEVGLTSKQANQTKGTPRSK